MGISDLIAGFIADTLNKDNGTAELQRSALAQRFNCVPSQINYVISTRFSPEHGYIVESRRGGGGYIRITRVIAPAKQLVMHTVNSIGNEIDYNTASAFVSNICQSGVLSKRDAKLILTAIGDMALKPVPAKLKNKVRANIFKYMLINTI